MRSKKNQKPWKCCGIYYIKTTETYFVSCKKIQQTKILVLVCDGVVPRDLFGSQIPLTTGGFELQISSIQRSHLTH